MDLDVGNIGIEHFLREKLAFDGFAAGIADGTGRAARKCDGDMAVELESTERDERDEIADVEAVPRGIEAAVQGDGTGSEPFEQFDFIRAIGQEAAPFQFFVNVHPQTR